MFAAYPVPLLYRCLAKSFLVFAILSIEVASKTSLAKTAINRIPSNSSITHIDFGIPLFKHSPTVRDVINDLNVQESRLLDIGRWLTLEDAVYTALANNPDLASAYADIESKQWSVIAARRRWYPSLTLEPVQDSSVQLSSQPGDTGGISQYLNTSATLEWTFFDQTRGPNINASVGELNAQRLLFDIAARNLILSVQSNYYKLQEQIRLVDQYRLLTLLSTRLLDEAIDERGSYASSNEIDQLRTTQRAQLRYLIDSYVTLSQISAELSRLLGLPINTMVLPADPVRSQISWEDNVEATVQHAEDFREEIIAAMQQTKVELWRSSELMASYWPKISVLGVETFDGGESSRTVGLGFKWSAFDGGIKSAEAANRKMASKSYDLKAKSLRFQVSAEVRQAYSRFRGADLNIRNASAEVGDSWNAFYGAIRLFQANKVDATTLIQTQSQLVTAISEYQAAYRARNTGLAELYRYSARWPPGTANSLNKSIARIRDTVLTP